MRKFLPVVIFVIAIFLRLSRLSELMYFMIDEDRYSFIMKRIFIDHKLILAGVTIPGGIYLGPAYFYVSGLLQVLVGFNPAMMGAIASVAGIVATLGIYLIGKKFFGSTAGIIAMAIYAFSYLTVIYNRIYWTLTWSSLAALSTYWGLYQITTKKKFGYVYLMAGWFILGSQSDASYFSLIILAAIFLWRKISPPAIKPYLLISLAAFIVFQLPLIGFELRHNFPNLHRISQIFTGSSTQRPSLENSAKSLLIFPKTLADVLLITPPYEVTYRLSPAEAALSAKESSRPIFMIVIAAVILLAFSFYHFPKVQKLPAHIINSHLQIAIAGVVLYSLIFPGYVHTWFLTIFLPAFALIIGWMGQILAKHRWKYVVMGLVVIFSLFNIRSLLITNNLFGFTAKKQAVQYAISQVGNKKFFLNSLGSQAYGGYRYLFWLYGKEPSHSYMDNIYSDWMYPAPAANQSTDIGVIMINVSPFEPESPQSLINIHQARTNALTSKKFSGVEVLIIPSLF